MKHLFLLLIISCVTIQAQSLEVITATPTSQSLTATPSTTITITFNEAINPATITPDSFMVFGRWSGPMPGTYSFEASNTQVTFTPQRDFFYGEIISVRLTTTVANTNGELLTHGYGHQFWTKTLPASLNLDYVTQFSTEEPGETFIQSYGAYAGDVNDDEYTDLVVVTEQGNDIRVFLNDQSGGYTNFTIFNMPNADTPSTNDGADFNHDGLIDIAIGSTQNNNVSVMMGNSTTTFEAEVGYTADTGIRGIAVIDLNGDGWDDIATANRAASTFSTLFNDGTGNFLPATTIDLPQLQGETCMVAADANNDGIMDLIMGGFSNDTIVTLLNDGTGNFTIGGTAVISGHPWMMASGDVNGDGNVDIVTGNSSNGQVSVVVGDGTGGLSVLGEYPSGQFTLAIDLGDIDGDGDLDLIGSNFGTNNFTQYENDGTGNFINPINYDTAQAGSCAIFHDRNNDGAMDITLIDEIEDIVILYENNLSLGVIDEEADTIFRVTPNPFSSEISIKGILDTQSEFKLFDMQGRLLFSEIIPLNKTIDLSSLVVSKGNYIAEITSNNKIERTQLIKE